MCNWLRKIKKTETEPDPSHIKGDAYAKAHRLDPHVDSVYGVTAVTQPGFYSLAILVVVLLALSLEIHILFCFIFIFLLNCNCCCLNTFCIYFTCPPPFAWLLRMQNHVQKESEICIKLVWVCICVGCACL